VDTQQNDVPPDASAIEESLPPGPWAGEMLEVTGRGSDGTRGLPPVHSITVTGPDGQGMTFGRPANHDEGEPTRVHVFGAPEGRNFDICPICGSIEGLTREHVPQQDLGGTVMTYTCGPCNNRLGSRVEDELRHWFDDAIFDVRFSGGDVQGRRRVPRILLRPDSEGRVGMIFDVGKIDPALAAILKSGTGQIEYRVPNPRVWRLAALKHAYLAACLALREIPNTDHAAAVRGVLVAARDGEGGELPPETGLSKGLRLARSHKPAEGPTVLLVALVDAEGQPKDYGFSFAGTLFVSWPLDASLFWEAVRRLGGALPGA
jgi:HNH endonuclease